MVKDITIVSLSRGIIGEKKVAHEIEIGLRRLEELGINVHFSEHAMSGLEYIDKHPEDRAKDLIDAFNSDTDMIFCAIGGEDTYRLLPYLFDHDELKNAVSKKIFLGFSDTTWNHFMLHKVGLDTFYGQAFFSDTCDIGPDMLPYTRQYFEELLKTGTISKITPSDVWYEGRSDFSVEAIGTTLPEHENEGFELLCGSSTFSGPIFGGCIDSIYDMFDNTRFSDTVEMTRKYDLFPSNDDWKGKILLLESSEEQPSPEKYRRAVRFFKDAGVLDVINGVLLGKPVCEKYFDDYKTIWKEETQGMNLPVLANISVGHGQPRAIVPFGRMAHIDAEKQEIIFE